MADMGTKSFVAGFLTAGILAFILYGGAPGGGDQAAAPEAAPANVRGLKPAPPISAEFPFESHYVEVLGSRLHYVDEGQGDPFLFLHGNPTSSYLWRNIIPYVTPLGRAVAVDNIGFGKSDKPDIDYTYQDHIKYIDGFIEALDLKNITLVVHDWGSAMGFDYASRHPDRVKGLVFMEAIMPPNMPVPSIDRMPPPFKALRDPEKGPAMIYKKNFFVEVMMPASINRTLSAAEMDAYRAPFLEEASRKPTLVWPNEIPIAGVPARNVELIERYGAWLEETDLPKLHLYVRPGAISSPEIVDSLKGKLKNYETVFLGPGIHFVQEDHPEAIGRAIADWHRRNFQ